MKQRPEPQSRLSPAKQENYNRKDCVETASVDSFPASDPPGWICTKAAPEDREAAKRKRP